MLFIEKQLEELRRIDDPVTRESDFDDFWNGNIAKVAAHDSHPEMKYLKDYPVENIRIYDVRVHGLDETPVHAWVLIPAKASPKNKVPAAVAFHGGNGSRGKYPFGWLYLAAAGHVKSFCRRLVSLNLCHCSISLQLVYSPVCRSTSI